MGRDKIVCVCGAGGIFGSSVDDQSGSMSPDKSGFAFCRSRVKLDHIEPKHWLWSLPVQAQEAPLLCELGQVSFPL